METFDAIVVGLGAMGSAATYHLAKRKLKVLGLEKYTLNHGHGSSHGKTRIIRTAYYEHPSYVPLAKRAFELWSELQEEFGKRLLTTGGIMIGPERSELVQGTLASELSRAGV